MVGERIDLLSCDGSSKFNAHPMDLAIVDQGNPCNILRNLHAIKFRTNDAAIDAARILDRDFVARDCVTGAASLYSGRSTAAARGRS